MPSTICGPVRSLGRHRARHLGRLFSCGHGIKLCHALLAAETDSLAIELSRASLRADGLVRDRALGIGHGLAGGLGGVAGGECN